MLGLASATWAQASADASKAAAAGETSASSAAPVHYYSAQQVDAGFESAAGIGMIYNGDGGTRNFLIMAATRSTPGGGELHMKFTDVIYVVKGSATLITGGQLSGVDENAINPSTGKPFPKDEIRSKSVAGGEPHHLAAGDMIVVPNGVPHQFSRVEGQFRYQLIKIRQP
jgi:uncharacterized RmlC-like cupin family protein